MIYFMQPIDGGPVKIGYSRNVAVRHKQLEGQYGIPLTIRKKMPGSLKDERRMHLRFTHLRIGTTEQFTPGLDLMRFLGAEHLAVPDGEHVPPMPLNPLRRHDLIVMKCVPEYRAWFAKLVEHLESAPSRVLAKAINAVAKDLGFEEPPKR